MILEWAACTELDPAFMHVWRSPAPITNVLGLPEFRAFAVPILKPIRLQLTFQLIE